MKRLKFDDLILELSRLGCESWDDLKPENRARLIRLYFDEYPEWGDALFEGMEYAMNAFESRDLASFGVLVACKMGDYVKPYIDKQLAYQALCRREEQEIANEC